MTSFFYNLLIFPIIQIIELSYLFLFRVFDSHGLSILGLSAIISLLTLPLYFKAENWQTVERNIQKQMRYGITKIKSVFRGDEQYLILSTFYRQHHYHPIFALRSTFGILIQIPFFAAAFSFLSNLEVLKNSAFFFITDLGRPDSLLLLNGRPVNILPFIMTLINIGSGILYTKELFLKDRIQVFGLAAVFLLLLYNSPSGLVLYWTANNLISLFKNILLQHKRPLRLFYLISCTLFVILDVFLIFFHTGYYLKRLIVVFLSFIVFLLPAFRFIFKKLSPLTKQFTINNSLFDKKNIFIFSALNIFLLAGVVIPSSLISSSVEEFSFIETYTSPFPFLFVVINQTFGIFVFWPLCIYFLFSQTTRKYFSAISCLLLLLVSVNNFVFSGNYGYITNTLVLSNPGTFFTNIPFVCANIFILLIIVILFFLLTRSRYKNIIPSVLLIIFISFLGMGGYNFLKIQNHFNRINDTVSKQSHPEILEPVFRFSKEGKNVIVIMLDRAIGAFVPAIFDEKPELMDKFSGFVHYPNSVSYGRYTIFAAPPLYGGYEYVPIAIQERDKETLIDKYNESLLVLPKIFLDNDFMVTVTDPPWANFSWKPDLEIYRQLQEEYGDKLLVDNISGKYASLWLENHPEAKIISISKILDNNLIRFSFFKISPAIIRTFIFDRGKWLSTSALSDEIDIDKKLTISTINDYSVLDLLPDITNIAENGNNFSLFTNLLTHEPAFFQVPEYTPVLEATNIGNGPFSHISEYHANMAAFLLLGKWFDFLRKNNVYDNTKIIIVSDHGWSAGGSFSFDTALPNDESLLAYNTLLMVKDFSSNEKFYTNNNFMTNADVPLLSLENIITTPVNPFTNKPLITEKSERVFITNSSKLHPTAHSKYVFKIENNEWLSVKDSIFVPENWSIESFR